MRKSGFIFCFLLFGLALPMAAQDFVIGKKDSIQSIVLNEQRFFNVYLPASYAENTVATFPVLYLIDGDYNFIHVSGLVEQLSTISQKIPEMIVVGISDSGHEKYLANCTPYDSLINPTGNAENFAQFITDELKPLINQQYQTSSFDFLVGHSLGGLFVVNTLLKTPEKFQNYVAISPSLWWNDYEAKDKVLPFYELYDNLDRTLYISLGDEKGMGVLGFADQLDIGDFSDTYLGKTPLGLKYLYKRYPNENHNSVGLISLSDALKWRFAGYEFDVSTWSEIDNFEKYIAHIAPFQKIIGDGYRIPENQLNVFVKKAVRDTSAALDAMEDFLKSDIPASLSDYYRLLGVEQLNSKDPDTAILTLRKSMEVNPENTRVYTELAKCFAQKGDDGMAKHYHQKAYQTAKIQGARSWYLNQLKANLE